MEERKERKGWEGRRKGQNGSRRLKLASANGSRKVRKISVYTEQGGEALVFKKDGARRRRKRRGSKRTWHAPGMHANCQSGAETASVGQMRRLSLSLSLSLSLYLEPSSSARACASEIDNVLARWLRVCHAYDLCHAGRGIQADLNRFLVLFLTQSSLEN
jgi:hypothetical protein